MNVKYEKKPEMTFIRRVIRRLQITNVVFGFRCRQKGGFDHE